MIKAKSSNKLYVKVFVLIFLLLFTFAFAMIQGGFVSWFIFFVSAPFMVYAILLAFVPIRVKNIRRTITPDHIVRGGKVNVRVSFENKTTFPLLFLTVREKLNTDELDIHTEGKSNNLFLVGFRKYFEWSYELRNVPRGEFVFEGLEVVVTDFFGWIERVVTVNHHDIMLVYPKETNITFTTINVQYDQGGANVNRSLVKDTTVSVGVRKYESGDRFSWIHWKSFAKSGELRTKEFEDVQAQSVVLYLDRSVQPFFEESVDLAASLLKVGVQHRADISFFTAGTNRKLFPLIRTESQLNLVMQYLATTQMEHFTTTIEHSLRSEHGLLNRSIALVVTSRVDDDLEKLLMSGSKYARAIICFVVISEEQLHLAGSTRNFAGQNKLIYLTESMFKHALVEVNK
jgi:uncharacterized protein (DUF58 family)